LQIANQLPPIGRSALPTIVFNMHAAMHTAMHTAIEPFAIVAAWLAVVAATFTAVGLRQRRARGWVFWASALWLAALGAALGACSVGGTTGQGTSDVNSLGQSLAALLLMQWPVLCLIGLRRFNARQTWLLSERHDWRVLAAAVLLVLGTWALAAADTRSVAADRATIAAAICAVALHLYTACLLFMGPSGRDSTPLQGLAAAIALSAFAPGLNLSLDTSMGVEIFGPLQAHALAAVPGLLVMALVVITLAGERTERQLRESRRRLRTLANMDALTQVPNRRHFHELASLAIARDPPGSAVLLILDVDHFKHINDSLGHAMGDRALCLLSAALIEHLRAPDVAGRHGGDEFVLLLRRASTQDAMGVAARIVAGMQARASAEGLPHLSLSLGMVQVAAGEGVVDALRRADQALYEAKRQGRSRAVAARGNEAAPVFAESQRLGLTGA
jgi:diguanylate cyclase